MAVVAVQPCIEWIVIKKKGSLPGPLLFLIYINDLPDGLFSNVKLLADDTSLFSVVHDIHSSASELNKDLKTINEWAFQ